MLIFTKGKVEGVRSDKTTSYNLTSHSHNESERIDGEKESIERRHIHLGLYLTWNTTRMLLDQTITIYCTKSVDM